MSASDDHEVVPELGDLRETTDGLLEGGVSIEAVNAGRKVVTEPSPIEVADGEFSSAAESK